MPARAFRDARGRTQLILAHYVNRRLIGPDLAHLRRDCTPVFSSASSPDPATYADREWLASVYTSDGKTVYALVHDEFQGHRHPGRCSSGVYLRCWYNAITLVVSHDGGTSYERPDRSGRLVAAIPQPYEADAGPAGIFEPSNIVRNPRNGYFYVLAREIAYGGSLRGTCVLRTRRLDRPGSWRAWNGNSFSVRFQDPYRMSSGRLRFCLPVATGEIGEMAESLTFNPALDRFLLVGMSSVYDPGRRRLVTGVYYSTSDDLVLWSPRRLLFVTPRPQTFVCGDPDPIAYPSVIDPSSTARSFDTSGTRAFLYFTRLHYRNCQQTFDRDLVRVPITIARQP